MNIDEIKTRDDIARFCKVEGIEVTISHDYDNYPNTALIEVVNFRDVTTMRCTDWYARTEKGKIEFIKNVIKKACIKLKKNKCIPDIEDVIFNNPATIVFWADGSKTVVKCQDDDIYDPEKGLAMAISKKALGNQGNYCNDIKKWLPEEETSTNAESAIKGIIDGLNKKFTIPKLNIGKRNSVESARLALLKVLTKNKAKKKDYEEAVDEAYKYLGEALED